MDIYVYICNLIFGDRSVAILFFGYSFNAEDFGNK